MIYRYLVQFKKILSQHSVQTITFRFEYISIMKGISIINWIKNIKFNNNDIGMHATHKDRKFKVEKWMLSE